MHLGEGILPAAHAAGWGAVAALALAVSRRPRRDTSAELPPDVEPISTGLTMALIFAVTLLPVPVPVVGATSHVCATPVLALLLGWRAVVVPTLLSLAAQALFFAHGGLSTLGANLVTLGLVGPLVGVGLARLLRAWRVPALVAIGVACALADVAVYAADCAILGAALAGERPFSHWFVRIALGFAPVQLPLAALEGVLSASLALALVRRRPELAPRFLATATLLVLLLVAAPAAHAAPAARYAGADDTVLAASAAAAGRPGAPFIELDGELHSAALAAAMLTAGFVAGRGWERISGRGKRGR